jgi:DNA-binding IclR family transcriptional regulator
MRQDLELPKAADLLYFDSPTVSENTTSKSHVGQSETNLPRANLSTPRIGKPRKANQDRYFSRAVGKALDVLEYLKRQDEPLSLHGLTSRLGGAKTSVFRLLRTLEAAGYVSRNHLGLYSLSDDARNFVPSQFASRLIQAAEPRIKEIVRQFRETSSVACLFDNHIEVVAVVESPQVIRMGNTVGRILQPHASSLGKAITAFQTEERREHLLRSYGIYQYTPHTITDERELRAEFERICSNGYSVEREESHLQGCCFAVPVFLEDESAIAAVSISMPLMRLTGEEQEARFIAALKQAAQRISRDLRASVPAIEKRRERGHGQRPGPPAIHPRSPAR